MQRCDADHLLTGVSAILTSRGEVASGIISCRTDADMVFNEPHLILRDGTPVLIRRLEAYDAALYPDFLGDVTAEDLRLRFFASVHEVNHALLDKLIHYDPARAMAFIAVDEPTERCWASCACMMTQAEKVPNLQFWCVHRLRAKASVGY
jgi:hypothetical protein